MATMTFQVNDAGGSAPAVWVTISENADGTLRFDVSVEGSYTGDLRGLFFDLGDEALINTLTISPVTSGLTEYRQGDDSITNLGDGANMNGMLGTTDKAGYDVGIEIGSSGIGKDDYQAFSFVLDSSLRDLSLADFTNIDFGVRLTSVGEEDGLRSGSSKILEVTSPAIQVEDDAVGMAENDVASGNLLDNDRTGLNDADAVSLTGWSGGALGEAIVLENAAGATLTINADGSYVLDASAADALSEGEHLTFAFTYDARAQSEATSWSEDSGVITVTLDGVNDGPVAGNDSLATTESTPASGNVLSNDDDIDRLDTISVASINGVAVNGDQPTTILLDSGAIVTISTDGTYSYDANGAFDSLNDGETATDGFEYTIVDNHGAISTAQVEIAIAGEGSPDAEDPNTGDPVSELSSLGLSHGYWKTHDGYPNPDDWNIAHDTSFEEYFGVDAGVWVSGNGPSRQTLNDIMFDEALELNGGDKYALAREAVTAVLNAIDEKNGTVYDFAYTVDEVRTLVQDALVSNDPALIEATKDLLEASHH